MRAPKRVFITGATGFVGRHLIEYLAGGCVRSSIQKERRSPDASFEVIGTCFPERPEHCADISDRAPFVNLLYLDLRDGDSVLQAVKNARPEWVFHLAAISQVRASWQKRRETLETNLMGTFNLFEAVRLSAPKSAVLYVSSSDVYGQLGPQKRSRPYREEDRGGIASPYGFTKYAGELLAEFYARTEKLRIIIARPFPHTGPGQAADFVCSDWARQIALIEAAKSPPDCAPVLRAGNLSPLRDYSDVRDVVRAYVALIRKGKPGEAYNICSGRTRSLKEILRTLLSGSAAKIKVRTDPAKLRRADIPYLAGFNRKIRRETGWAPLIPLEATLRDLLQDWRERIAKSREIIAD
jgi:GDP-4-dehydro-6-deoxy-D-mannose reductase